MRLTLLMTENPLTDTPQANALLALMCFQCSRLEARTNERGEAILFDAQDRTRWDQDLIDRGNFYLVNATSGNEVSKYHLEAGIAHWHTTPTNENKWQHILNLYNQLILMDNSPLIALNRSFAFAQVYGNEKAIIEVEKLQWTESNYYHALLGYLYSNSDIDQAISHYGRALELSKSPGEKLTLKKEIGRLQAVR
jgi:predicted RNA polymerase sigma factor